MTHEPEQPPTEAAFAGPEGPHFTIDELSPGCTTGEIAPWTEVEKGRFMPRRVRGSFQGRALG